MSTPTTPTPTGQDEKLAKHQRYAIQRMRDIADENEDVEAPWLRAAADSFESLTRRVAELEAENARLKPCAVVALEAAMSDYSENTYCSGWYSFLEYDLWELVESYPDVPEHCDKEAIGHIKELRNATGMWCNSRKAVPIEEFRASVAAYKDARLRTAGIELTAPNGAGG